MHPTPSQTAADNKLSAIIGTLARNAPVLIGEGILSAAGSVIFSAVCDQMFGPSGDEDVGHFLEEAIRRFSQIVRDAIAEDCLRAAKARLESLMRLLTEYHTSPSN